MQPRLISDLMFLSLPPQSRMCHCDRQDGILEGRSELLKCLVRFSRCPFLRSFEISVFCTGHRFILSDSGSTIK